LIIGLAVACVVFILGRAFVGSGTARDQMQHQPGLSISASADRPGAASDTVASIVAETETASTAEPVPDHQAATKASRKARKPAAARSQEDVVKTPRRRRQKTNKPTAPATDVGTPATTDVSLGVPAAPDPR
jgi:hypothetical protein